MGKSLCRTLYIVKEGKTDQCLLMRPNRGHILQQHIGCVGMRSLPHPKA